MKGILLAGGRGTRLYPITRAVSKHLLPIYDKPMVYYPLCTLLLSGISDILLITSATDLEQFKTLLGDGQRIGAHISYAVQPFALGIADALRIGSDFIAGERCALILGDNLFIGDNFMPLLRLAANADDAVIFTYPVDNPSAYGIAEVENQVVRSLEEKPVTPVSNLAVTGLYFYPPDCAKLANTLLPSPRGELEITDLNRLYLENGRLTALSLPNNMRWLDTGTCDGLLKAINHIADIRSKGHNCGCIEEAAVQAGLIPRSKLYTLAIELTGTDYGAYLLGVCNDRI